MAKESFREKLRLRKDNIERLDIVNDIIDDFADQGYKLTLRQLYYQLVSKAIIPNRQEEYAKIGSLLVKGRMAGVVDWEAIEDRIRIPYIPYWVRDIKDAINDTIESYRLDRQKNQKNYIEVWVEKDALSGILKRITEYYHVYLVVNRGYSSCTAMHDAYKRLMRRERNDVNTWILYLGDHDPSGLDMRDDIEKRLNEFGVYPTIKHIAITMQQIKKLKPPPKPAKITDPRANWYIKKFGDTVWELDALNPKFLHKLLRDNIERLIDRKLFVNQIANEERDLKKLKKFVKGIQ
jgi:hypothetical protein